ncbi:MAG: SMP-30/gluconolactonase/LRE family protein, partial [Actinomycetota bacterium]
NGEVVRVDPRTGATQVWARGPGGGELDTPNMLAFDRAGHCYITCSGENGAASIVRVDPDGTVREWTTSVPAYPNGVCLDAAGDAIVVVESHRPALVRVPIEADGDAGPPRVIALLPDTEPDGVALGADGAYYVTLYRPDGVIRIDPATGDVQPVVHDPLAHIFDAPTNLAFAGPLLDRAVVANVGDRFLSIGDVGTTGAPLAYPEGP